MRDEGFSMEIWLSVILLVLIPVYRVWIKYVYCVIVCRLKKEKEEERVKEEKTSRELIEPRDPVTGETSQEALEREEHERKFVRQTMKDHERRIQKTKEMER